jgi:hypothetical protein
MDWTLIERFFRWMDGLESNRRFDGWTGLRIKVLLMGEWIGVKWKVWRMDWTQEERFLWWMDGLEPNGRFDVRLNLGFFLDRYTVWRDDGLLKLQNWKSVRKRRNGCWRIAKWKEYGWRLHRNGSAEEKLLLANIFDEDEMVTKSTASLEKVKL